MTIQLTSTKMQFLKAIKYMQSTLFAVCLIFMSMHSEAKSYRLIHSIDIGLMQAILPSPSYKVFVINPYVDFVYNKFKKYSYPSLRLRYSVTHEFLKNLELGIETGATLRYQQRIAVDNYSTFYSFPIGLRAKYNFLDLNQNKSIQGIVHAGYAIKHPKNKYWDGTGGYLFGAELCYFNNIKKMSLNVGYEIEQSKEYFLYKPELYSQPGEQKTYTYHRIVNGIYLGVQIQLN